MGQAGQPQAETTDRGQEVSNRRPAADRDTAGREYLATRLLAGRWDGVELCRAAYLSHRFPVHAHPEVHVALIERGRYDFRLEGRRHVAEAGDLLVFAPDGAHDGGAADTAGYAYRQILVPPGVWERVAIEEGGRLCWPRFPVLRRETAGLLLHGLFTADAGADPMLLDAGLARLIAGLGAGEEGGLPPRPATPSMVRRAVEMMQEGFAEPLTLADLADASGTSRFALSRAFRRIHGIGLHEWLMGLRLRHARRCLAAGMAAADAAAASGFADQSHLIRRFKRAYGVTPGDFGAACTSVQS